MKKCKCNSISEMFKDVLGEDSVVEVKPKQLAEEEIETNKQLNKAICDFIRRFEDACEASKNSILQFD